MPGPLVGTALAAGLEAVSRVWVSGFQDPRGIQSTGAMPTSGQAFWILVKEINPIRVLVRGAGDFPAGKHRASSGTKDSDRRTVPAHPILSLECVVEAEGRRVADGESWRDPSNACIACTCRVIWGEAGCRPHR